MKWGAVLLRMLYYGMTLSTSHSQVKVSLTSSGARGQVENLFLVQGTPNLDSTLTRKPSRVATTLGSCRLSAVHWPFINALDDYTSFTLTYQDGANSELELVQCHKSQL